MVNKAKYGFFLSYLLILSSKYFFLAFQNFYSKPDSNSHLVYISEDSLYYLTNELIFG
jgi:hypothetical protein